MGGSDSSSDSSEDKLTSKWTQTEGPRVTLNDPTSPNPTFAAPKTSERVDVTFRLIVTNEECTASEPDEVAITMNPITTPPPEEEPRTKSDIIKGIIQNPLGVTNSIDSANEIRDILTDDNEDNDRTACKLLNQLGSEQTENIRNHLGC